MKDEGRRLVRKVWCFQIKMFPSIKIQINKTNLIVGAGNIPIPSRKKRKVLKYN